MARGRWLTAAAAIVMFAAAACGSDSLDMEPEGGDAPPPSEEIAADPALTEMLPESIKSAGTIVIGTDASYAPNEFLAADGKTIQGMDVDLFNAVAAKLGVKTRWEPADFTTIITGVQGKKYDIGISSFTVNEERKEQVTMVSYFSAGTSWATQAGNPESFDIDDPCGKAVAVQTGTVQETDDLPARQQKCGDNKINILSFKGQDQATNAVVTGRAQAMLADSPVTAYAIQQSGGKLEPLGDVYEAAPYGYVLPKEQTEFGEAIVEALNQLKESGDYEAALSKWGVKDGGIDDFAVNP